MESLVGAADGLCASLNTTFRSERPSCFFDTVDLGRLDAVAGIRLIASSLGLIGSLSIVGLSLGKCRVLSSEVHPIFMIALADSMLALLLIAGSALWLSPSDSYSHVWCYAVTLMTAIVECASINLTVAYALFAFVSLKRIELGSLLLNHVQNEVNTKLSVVVYAVAWLTPLVIVMTVFGGVEGFTHLLRDTSSCSCWCIPSVVNIIPLARATNNITEVFVRKQLKFLVGVWIIIFINYIIVFGSLLVLYYKILRKIKIYRVEYEQILSATNGNYGARMTRGQAQARKRVLLFLTVFLISGFFNTLLTGSLVLSTIPNLENFTHMIKPKEPISNGGFLVYLFLLYAQSVTLSLQGFMNAIVYGWTREDFFHALNLHTDEVEVAPTPVDTSSNSEDPTLTTSYMDASEDRLGREKLRESPSPEHNQSDKISTVSYPI